VEDRELRSVLWGDTLLRTSRYVQMLEEGNLDEDVHRILVLLSNHSPTSNKRDVRGASLRQMGYICTLADFDEDLTREFARIISMGGGLDSGQAHTIIKKLKWKRGRSNPIGASCDETVRS
jgi:Fe-S-cluster formation regulator IscX/YfhJ